MEYENSEPPETWPGLPACFPQFPAGVEGRADL